MEPSDFSGFVPVEPKCSLVEGLRKTGEKLTGKRKARVREAHEAVRQTKPLTFRFNDDGLVSNNSAALPFVLYRDAVRGVGPGGALGGVVSG